MIKNLHSMTKCQASFFTVCVAFHPLQNRCFGNSFELQYNRYQLCFSSGLCKNNVLHRHVANSPIATF